MLLTIATEALDEAQAIVKENHAALLAVRDLLRYNNDAAIHNAFGHLPAHFSNQRREAQSKASTICAWHRAIIANLEAR